MYGSLCLIKHIGTQLINQSKQITIKTFLQGVPEKSYFLYTYKQFNTHIPGNESFLSKVEKSYGILKFTKGDIFKLVDFFK